MRMRDKLAAAVDSAIATGRLDGGRQARPSGRLRRFPVRRQLTASEEEYVLSDRPPPRDSGGIHGFEESRGVLGRRRTEKASALRQRGLPVAVF